MFHFVSFIHAVYIFVSRFLSNRLLAIAIDSCALPLTSSYRTYWAEIECRNSYFSIDLAINITCITVDCPSGYCRFENFRDFAQRLNQNRILFHETRAIEIRVLLASQMFTLKQRSNVLCLCVLPFVKLNEKTCALCGAVAAMHVSNGIFSILNASSNAIHFLIESKYALKAPTCTTQHNTTK